MNSKKLLISSYLNNPRRGIPSYINDPEQLRTAHTHDFYELFLVHKGRANHFVNGFVQPLSPTTLVFIRPGDYHYYDNMSKDFQIINMIISSEVIDELFNYLGSGFSPDRLLSQPLSPCAHISQNSFSELLTDLEQLAAVNKIMKNKADSLFRIIIMNIITKYFPITFTEDRDSMPKWFRVLYLEMLRKENFVEGLPRMHELSGKTLEHMTRICHKYLNKTPTQFINEIRIAHSIQLLISTDKKVVDICYDVGFSNLSNYYHLFSKLFGMSPQQLRRGKDTAEVIEKVYKNWIVDSNITQGLPIE